MAGMVCGDKLVSLQMTNVVIVLLKGLFAKSRRGFTRFQEIYGTTA